MRPRGIQKAYAPSEAVQNPHQCAVAPVDILGSILPEPKFCGHPKELDIAVEALRLVRAGGVYFPVNPVLHGMRAPAPPSKTEPTFHNLRPKEAAVTELIRQGKPNKTIAYELNMCETTVKVPVRNIMKKLRARNRTHVAFIANQTLDAAE